MTRIIIAYASAGSGHKRAAEALYLYIKEHCPEVQPYLVDVLDKSSPLFKKTYNQGYTFLVSRLPWLWGIAFWLSSTKGFIALSKLCNRLAYSFHTRAFADFLRRIQADCIISTHFMPAEIAAVLKKRHKVKSKIITVITDFGVHPFWVSEPTDFYIVASVKTRDILGRRYGIAEEKIRACGIPVDPAFFDGSQKEKFCAKLGIAPDKFTVLAATGSFGIGPLEEIADILHERLQLLVVCGNNRKLYNRLKAKDYPNVKVFGFINYMHELMAASDMIITKPGGLSISEALAMELVPVFISPIPGQETANMRFLMQNGIGHMSRNARQIESIIIDYMSHTEKLEETRRRIRQIKRPYAVKEICRVVC